MRAFIVACAIAAATASLALPASASPPTTGAHVHPAVAAVSLGVPRGFTISDNATVLTSVQLYVAHHPGDFSGLWAEPPNSTLYIGVSGNASASVVNGVHAAAVGTETRQAMQSSAQSLVFVRARYSSRELQRTMNSVASSTQWARLAGRLMVGWFISDRNDDVVIGLTHITSSIRKAALTIFGPDVQLTKMTPLRALVYKREISKAPRVVHVRTSQGQSAASATTSSGCSRLLDCSPYWGGDRLIWWNSSEVIECTQGFPWTPTGKPATFTISTTAGHCGPTGRTWYQGYYDTSNNTIYYTGIAGKDSLTSFGNNLPDGELLSSANMTIVVYANPGAYPSATITSYAQPYQGELVCADGSFTGQSCGAVQSTNGCYNISDNGTIVKVCDLAYVTASQRLVQSGDSGGPVYEYTSDSPPDVRMNGLISAGNSSGTELFFSNMDGLESALKGHPTT